MTLPLPDDGDLVVDDLLQEPVIDDAGVEHAVPLGAVAAVLGGLLDVLADAGCPVRWFGPSGEDLTVEFPPVQIAYTLARDRWRPAGLED